MKKILLSISTLLVASAASFAQGPPPNQYPFFTDFEASTFPTTGGSLASANWTQTGSQTFSTYATHGTAGSKGLTKAVHNFSTADTITTPQIGPLTATSQLSFDYRVVVYTGGIASTTPILGTGFNISFVAVVSIGGVQQMLPITSINSTTHVSSLSFASKSIALPALAAGQTGALRIIVQRGTVSGVQDTDYNFDFDNIRIANATTVGINSIANDTHFLLANDNQTKSIKILSENIVNDVTIFSVDGKQIYNSKNYTSGENIDLNYNGIYLLQCNVNGVLERKKFVIQ